MRTIAKWGASALLTGKLLASTASPVDAQDIVPIHVVFQTPAPESQAVQSPKVTLGRPTPISLGVPVPLSQSSPPSPTSQYIVRAQTPEPPPPPPSPFGGPGTPVQTGQEAFNCGVVNNDADKGNFFVRLGDKGRRCWEDLTGGFGASNRAAFQSDHAFDLFSSPVTSIFLMEDPRALTELRPFFIWQKTPDANPIFAGSSNFLVGAQARVALTERISIVANKTGLIFSNPDNPNNIPGYEDSTSLTELWLGPKFTIIRNDVSNTVAALGVTFQIPVGSSSAFQSTRSFSVDPYFSIAQNFLRSSYGSFNVTSTTGYALGFSQRSDYLHSGVELNFNCANANKIYPLLALNYAYYLDSGDRRTQNFEGRDIFNFGANQVGGLHNLTVGTGFRYNFSQHVQFGIAGEFNVLNSSRQMDAIRVTVDMILRY